MGTPEHSTTGDTAGNGTGPVGGLGRACHLGPVVAVTSLAAALAVIAGRGTGGCVLVGAAVMTGQLSVGWCNDAFDARRDTAAGRHGKPVVDGAITVTQVWTAAYAALALCVPLSLFCGLWAGAVHLAAVGAGWVYNVLLKATRWSWAPYALAFAALPAFVALGLPGHPWPAWWVVGAGALLGIGAHLGDVLPDIRGDLATGVRGWPQRLGPDRARLLLPVPLVIASALLALGPAGPPGRREMVALTVVLLVAVTGTVLGRRWERLAFATAIVVAAVDVTLLLSGIGIGTGPP
ncbi:UbiA family prenyltransferase [Streptomyces rhizosphaerihabitans]|uniref:UbiA family prenyltransferase n=1 Tax=Streptomyces rhizosphaerihabitans TaxID=1266770 RepID=UPI0021C205EF|nr:UbiA family prenyltransferase [Streptomyces rhizosphaerihabitans]MCT9009457.1 UbiA family prenyltransferase [Streptomyces rhizosphaerihabitans]